MQIFIHVLFATHIKLEKWKKKKKDFLIFLVNVLLLDYLESISLAYMSQPSLCVLTRLNEWCWLGQAIVNN